VYTINIQHEGAESIWEISGGRARLVGSWQLAVGRKTVRGARLCREVISYQFAVISLEFAAFGWYPAFAGSWQGPAGAGSLQLSVWSLDIPGT